MQKNTSKYRDMGIKKLWKLMLPQTKKDTVKTILDEKDFDVNDEIYVKQTWIWGGRIPDHYYTRVLEIFKNALLEQNKKTEEAISIKA